MLPSQSLPITHPSWATFLPNIPKSHLDSGPEDATVKTLIYVNKSIPTTALKPVETFSNCVTAVSYTAGDHTFTLISSYAPPKQSHKLEPLRQLLHRHPSSLTHHVLVGMDSNLHHPLWNPPSYRHTHREAEDLINLMSASGLSLRSQCGIPTFYPANISHAQTTIDLTWASPECLDWVVECKKDKDHTFSHLSDHAGITSSIQPPTSLPTIARTYRNWKKFDPLQFEVDIAARLQEIVLTLRQPALDQECLDNHTALLTTAVTEAINACVPRLPLKPGAKRWWDKAVLNPLKTAAQGSRRVYQRRRDESSRQVYLEASLAYRRGIHEAKQRHWREFLESLTPSTLFTASKYATGAFSNPALTVPPLRSHTGELTDAPEVQAELLFQGTSAPTVPCDLSDLLPPIDAAPPPPRPILPPRHRADHLVTAAGQGPRPGRDYKPGTAGGR